MMINKRMCFVDNQKKFHVGQEVCLMIFVLFVYFFFFALESQLQLAFINQVYFKDNNPEDIFGSVQIDVVREMVQSIVLCNTELPYVYSLSVFPANFV